MKIGRSSGGGGGGEKCPPGWTVGVLAAVFDIGRQRKSYAGEEKILSQLILVWEVDKRDSKGRRFTLLDYVTNSNHEKSVLARRVEALLAKRPEPDDFDTERLVGKSAYIRLVAPVKPDGWPLVKSVEVLPEDKSPIRPEASFSEENPPKYVVNARERAVGGYKSTASAAPLLREPGQEAF